jgi:hypothetical protein
MSRSSGDVLELDQVMLPVSQSDFNRVLEAVTDAEQEQSEEFMLAAVADSDEVTFAFS